MSPPILQSAFLSLVLASLPAVAAPAIVISQVYGGGGNSGAPYRNDYIELFNRDAVPVSLRGWSVQYAPATGSAWQVAPLPDLTLQPGQYLLMQQAAGAGAGAPLPAPEASGNLSLAASAGKVALVNGTATIASAGAPAVVDLVGFGAGASAFEGIAPAPAPSNTTAILRAAGGCGDSNNNATDFAATTPMPRNGVTAFHVCQAAAGAPIIAACPDAYSVPAGSGGATAVSASDADGIINFASLLSGAVDGITLTPQALAAAPGGAASFLINVSAMVPAGEHVLTLAFANNQAQTASCMVKLAVQAALATSRTIPQIQGAAAASPYAGTMQTTEGVVTLLVANGFYLQDPEGDGDPGTSDSIFVFTGAAPTVAVGDRIRLAATVAEFNAGDASRPVTQLTGVRGMLLLSKNNRVAPAAVTLPMSAADFERHEGMLVQFGAPLTVSQNYFQGRYGQVTLSAGRLEKPTNRYPAGSAQALAAAAANAASMIVLDDGKTSQNPVPVPYIGADNTLRAGDTVTGLTGVIDFGLITASNPGPSGYKLQPSAVPQFARDNPRSAPPRLPLGNVKAASFNVLNFFTTFGDGTTASGQSGQGCSLGASVAKSNCRGADNLVEFRRQRAKIVAAMLAIDADVFGLMEIQNNGDVAVASLVEALNAAAGAQRYAVVPRPEQTGSDAIRVAMIYKPSSLRLAGPALSDPDPVNSRPPMAQTFVAANGGSFSLIVNHMKSKGSCPDAGSPDADRGDGQGCWNATRLQQARRLAEVFVPQVREVAQDPDVLLMGDFNAYGAEDPIRLLGDYGFKNQIERFVRRGGVPYSYVFDGEAGYLDHALASAPLQSQVLGAAEWHINADEPSVIDYNTEFKPQDLYSATPYRSSDHDPVVVSLGLRGKPEKGR
ncbi:ExeM/NucH family extracellular endonuclease|uniref:ExeM/NucH family extracellular endonuclease n=1 Tax=Noviherbaspirillum sp. L7-7A TaxID=2850560 RepID=UPI001C2C6065|nr:ExeM/NucH family extracellular endonuclease [Noviherbaspirillum sp. L7-7A]MBV0878054.1 ExeM/NucH family extracellular endonuclease [Noviherbaspirillum sp. L7-7A]